MTGYAYAALGIADTAGPGFNNGYEWVREKQLEDGILAAEIATVRVIVPGIWCDMGSDCANGPGGHWWEESCCSAVLPWLPEPGRAPG